LVEKILGRSTEKSFHESGGKLEVFGLNIYEISGKAGFAKDNFFFQNKSFTDIFWCSTLWFYEPKSG
jgi:hypothetical protein